VHTHAAPAQRQRDAAGPDAELECRARASEVGKELRCGLDDVGVEHLQVGVVVGGDALAEAVRWHD